MTSHARSCLFVVLCFTVISGIALPGSTQTRYEPLFDKFNFVVEGSWVAVDSEIRLDSPVLGRGTTIGLEGDLDLAADKTIPTLAFQWQIAKRHRVGVRWQNIDRSSSTQISEEIQWGDEIIPVNAEVKFNFDIVQTYVDYAYYPWVKEKWAGGFGLGFRWMDLKGELEWRGDSVDEEGTAEAKGSGPLPYLYFEYRRVFDDRWRLLTGLGWLQVKIGDIDGGQWVGHVGMEYLLGNRWSFGAAVNYSTIDVDWAGIEIEEGNLVNGSFTWDINDISVFARIRF